MRKVYLSGTARIMVPVEIKFDAILRADDGANVDKAFKRFANGHPMSSGVDLEGFTLTEIVDVNGYEEDDLEAAIQEAMDSGDGFEILKVKVEDSK